ncbi:MAG: hypothetical protein HC929_24355 [Leptolyngbyaceae cyanobacterium SM2_5_2]|nr:hypothetical protein [Leptolyngbyaceae cyanobacterium SM2_5_2]
MQESQQQCDIWNVPAIDPAMREPVVSDVPALLFNGNFDPITPRPMAKLWLRG